MLPPVATLLRRAGDWRETEREFQILSHRIIRHDDDTEKQLIILPPPQAGGIKQYHDPSVRLSVSRSVCLSQGAAALGYRHDGCPLA